MPTTSGFADAPVIKSLVAFTVVGALLVTVTDSKYYLDLLVEPHLFGTPYSGQWWRLLVMPLVYTNSTEVLFAGMTLYQLRIVERIWGSRRIASFLITTAPYTTLLPPLALLLLRPLTGNKLNRLPAGPTAMLFSLLAQYHAAIPYTYRYRIKTNDESGFQLTSKSTSYLFPLQLALSQLPGSLIPAIVGWTIGYAWRMEILPTLPSRSWRLPGWFFAKRARPVGSHSTNIGTSTAVNNQVDGLRRRLELERTREA